MTTDEQTEDHHGPGSRPEARAGADPTSEAPQGEAPDASGQEAELEADVEDPEEVVEDPEEPEPFSDGPPPLPQPMLLLDGSLPGEPEPVEEDGGTCRCGGRFDPDGWCTECGERRPDPRHHFFEQPSALVAGVCDRGIRHVDNEDAMAVWADGGRAVLVVCDGVTMATRSAEASTAAAQAALDALVENTDAAPEERLVRATDAAARAVAQVGRDFPDAAPSCTIVSAVVEDGRATFGSVGDSRGYWLPDQGEPRRMTTDDSVAEEQVRAGMDRALAESGPYAHTITRWLGPDSPDDTAEISSQDVTAAGWVLVCTDGLWNYASEPADLQAVLRAQEQRVGRDPLHLAQALVRWANEQGGVDNITVALARTGLTAYPSSADDAPHESGQDGNHG